MVEHSIINKQNTNLITSKNTIQKHLFPPTPPYVASSPFRPSPFSMLSSINLRLLPNWSSNTQMALNPFFRVLEEERRQNNNKPNQDSNDPLIKSVRDSNGC